MKKLNLNDSLRRRISLILSEVEARGFEAVVFLNEVIGQNPSNFVYVSGPWGLGDEHGTLVFDVDGGSTVVMPHWGAKAMKESDRYDHVIAIKQEKSHHLKGTMEALVGYDPKNVCFDLSTVSAQFSHRLGDALDIGLTTDRDVSDHVFRLRAIKDDFEIAEIKRAIAITEEAVAELIQDSLPGVNTWDLKKQLDASMIKRGAYEFSFNSSIRFARGPDRPYDVIKHGDMLRVDVGCRVETGYCSDMGRTWPITFDAEARDYLDRAVAAHGEAMKNIKAGVSGNEVLERASEINLEYGFEPLIRCGHQIGLDCHDYTMPYAPNFGPIETDSQILEKGMTLTFEPQHIDSKTDMRSHIEDIVLVTEGEPEILNELPWKVTWQ